MKNEKTWRSYFSQTSNVMDFLSIVFNTITLILRWRVGKEYDLHVVRLTASLGLVFMYFQFFYWLRTFDDLAQYVDLIA